MRKLLKTVVVCLATLFVSASISAQDGSVKTNPIQKMIKSLEKDLEITSDQKEKILTIAEAYLPKFGEDRKENGKLQREMMKEISTNVLTEEQRNKFAEIREARRKVAEEKAKSGGAQE